MAIFTTLVTGVKILKKVMDKKKQKEAAKKFVGGGKEEKRAKVSKIVAEMDEKPKAKVIKPDKLMNIDIDEVAKVTPDAAKIDYKVFTQKIDNIVGMTDALAFLTGAQAQQKKDELKLLQKQREEEKKRKKEAKLEKKGDGALGKIGKGIKKTAKGPLDMATNFITKMAIGALVIFLLKNADKIKEIFKTIGDNLNKFSKLLRVTIFAIQQSIVLAKKGVSAAVKGASKLFSPIGKAFKAIGSKIKTVFKGLGSKIVKMLSKIPGVEFIKNLAKGFTQGIKTVGNVAKTIVSTSGNVVKTVLKAPGKLITKLFGENAAKAVAKSGKLFKTLGKAAKGIKIPVLGPIIVAVTSILSGDPIGKTMFKTLGAAFGGMIGGAFGAVLGGVGAPFGVILGEIVGEFIGDTLYEMFNGDESGTKGTALLKKKLGELVTGAGKAGKAVMDFALSFLGKAGNFIKDGVNRFIEDFPVKDISKIFGLPSALGAVAGMFGLNDPKYKDGHKINRLPDLSLFTPFGIGKLISHLKNSLFPSGQKETVETSTIGPDDFARAREIEEGNKKLEQAAADLKDGKITQEEYDKILKDLGRGGSLAVVDDEFTSETTTQEGTKYAVRYYDKEGNEIDPLSPEAENLKNDAINMLKGEDVSSDVSAISNKTSYEESGDGAVVLTKPERKNYTGRSGQARYEQAMIMYNNQKEMLNSYQKTQVKLSLAKI